MKTKTALVVTVCLMLMTTEVGSAQMVTPRASWAAPSLRYVLDLPRGYGANPTTRYPLVVYLHGAGESGFNLDWLRRHGPPKYFLKHPDAPFILLAPQAPRAIGWQMFLPAVQQLMKDVQAQYRIDPTRMYLTGNSMGGNGAWELARQMPEAFAAVVPVASFFAGDAQRLCVLKNTAIWVIHGLKDTTLPASGAEKIVRALRACGLNPKQTLLDETDHVATNEAYADPKFYEWLLQHKKS